MFELSDAKANRYGASRLSITFVTPSCYTPAVQMRELLRQPLLLAVRTDGLCLETSAIHLSCQVTAKTSVQLIKGVITA